MRRQISDKIKNQHGFFENRVPADVNPSKASNFFNTPIVTASKTQSTPFSYQKDYKSFNSTGSSVFATGDVNRLPSKGNTTLDSIQKSLQDISSGKGSYSKDKLARKSSVSTNVSHLFDTGKYSPLNVTRDTGISLEPISTKASRKQVFEIPSPLRYSYFRHMITYLTLIGYLQTRDHTLSQEV